MKTSIGPTQKAILLAALFPLNALCEHSDGAHLTVVAQNDNSAVLVRQVTVDTYANRSCEGHKRIQYIPIKRKTESNTGKQLKIEAGRPFVVDLSYIQPSYGLSTTCSVAGSFLPEKGKSYVARFNAVTDGSSCGAAIYDVSPQGEIPIPFSTNESPCAITMNPSGVGTKVKVRVKLLPQP